MKQTRKILIALLVVATLLMSMATLFVSAASQPETLYLTPNANWKKDGARFAAYFFGNGEKWVSMSDSNGDGVYEVAVPTDKVYPKVIFCRMNPSAAANNWNNKWNQTADLTIPTSGTNHFTVKEGTWDKGGGTWSTMNSTCSHVAGPAATCTTDQVCTKCGDTIVSALGHNYNSSHNCTKCGGQASFTVAGTGAHLGTEWDTTNTANDMTYAEGVYTKVYTNVAAGSYKFKVARDHDWGTAYPSADKSFTVSKSGSTVTITLKGTSVTVTVEAPHVHSYVYGVCSCGDVNVTALSGAGTEADPYLVNNIHEFTWFRDQVNAGNSYDNMYIKLTADIDLAGIDWAPIGNGSNPFNGMFDGDNHVISNLTINGSKSYVSGGANDNYKGLFGYMKGGNDAGIKNITLNNAKVTGCLYVGTILGRSYTGGIIENCHVKGLVQVDSYSYAGGIVGRHEYSSGKNVNGDVMSIFNCTVNGIVLTRSGSSDSFINADYAVSYVGGIVGFMSEGNYVIDGCSAANVSVQGTYGVGGISGIAHYGNTISNAAVENIKVVSVNNDPTSTRTGNVGLVAGAVQGTASEPSVFENVTVTNTTGSVTYTDATSSAINANFGNNMNGSKPVVIKTLSGSGTEADPFIIADIDDLLMFRDSVNAGETKYNAKGVYVALGANIDLAGIDWSVNIGDDCNATFDGIFDGKGYTIYNLTSTETAAKADGYVCAGLFGAIYGDAVIKNLVIENVTIDTGSFSGNNVAAVVGFVYNGKGAIENVTVCGDINISAAGVYGVGVIVGYSYYNNGFEINNCKVVANAGSGVTAVSGVGGIIGYTNGDVITNCEVSGLSIGATAIAGGISGTTLNVTVDNVSIKDVSIAVSGEYWVNSTGIVAGCFSDNKVNISNVTSENVTGAIRTVGSSYAEKPTAVVPAAAARIGGAYYTSIADAISAAKSGETVTILAGNYTGNLNVNNGITVVGETDANGNNLVNFAGKLNITANGAAVKNVNVNNGGSTAGYIYANDVLVEGCTVVGGNGFRYCYTSGVVTFKNSVITGSTYGIHFDGNAGGEIVIDNCVITGWTSFAGAINKVSMTDTSFEEGNYNYVRFYQSEIVIEGCTFNEKMAVDVATSGANVVVNNCVVENGAIADIFYDEDLINSEIVVDSVKLYPVVALINGTEFRGLSLQDALNAAVNGDTVALIEDVTLDSKITVADGITLDLNGKTLSINVENSSFGNVTIKNGSVVLGKDDVHVCDGYFIVNAGKTIVLDGVNVSSAEGGIKGYAVFHLKTGANLDVINSTLNIGANEYEAGYVVYAGEKTATVDITGSTITADGNGIVHANTTITNSTISIDAAEHGINRSAVTIADSNVTIFGGWGRGITAQHGDLVITGNSVVTVLDMDEATVELRNNGGLTVDASATLKVDAAVSNTGSGTVSGEIEKVVSTPNADGGYDLSAAVAEVNGTFYTTLAGAISAATAGDTVYVFAGTYALPTLKAGIAVEGVGEVLFEGTLSGTLENLTLKNLHIKGANAQRWAYAKGNLVFENVTFEATSVYALHFDGITAGATLLYKDCTIIGWAAMSGSPASCEFVGCTIKGNGSYGLIRTYFNATIEDCTFDVSNVNTNDVFQDGIHAVDATVIVNNCTNVNGDMKEIIDTSKVGYVVLDGETIHIHKYEAGTPVAPTFEAQGYTPYTCPCGDTYNSDFVDALIAVAQIGATKYETLAEAFAAGGEITLLTDITLTETLVVAKGVTVVLNLNGKTVSMNHTDKVTKNHTMISNNGHLTINDTAVLTRSGSAAGKLSYIYSGESIGTSYSTNTITANPGSTLVVNGGIIENNTFDSSVIAYAIDGLTNGNGGDVTVIINGGTIIAKRQAVRIFANSTTNTGTLEINGGDITGRVIMQNANSKANKAALKITGGTFNVNDYKPESLYLGGSTGATMDVDALVSGGTFNGEVISTTQDGFISGGTFSNDISELTTDGFVAVRTIAADGSEIYSIIEQTNAAPSIGDNGNWFIGDVDTGVKAEGVDGHTPKITIGANGNWHVDGEDTGVKAQGEAGHSPVITIGANNNWHIDGVDTGVRATPINGVNGDTPYIGANGNWYIGGNNTGVKAEGVDGHTPVITIQEVNGVKYWFIDGVNQNVKAEGIDGHTPVIEIKDDKWYIDGVESGWALVYVVSVDKTATNGLEDTWTITYNNGDKFEFTVTNGETGATGNGIKDVKVEEVEGGKKVIISFTDENVADFEFTIADGVDGDTPVIEIIDGYWHIDGENTGIMAIGQPGRPGADGQDGIDGDKGADGNDNNQVVIIAIAVATGCIILSLGVLLFWRVRRRSWWCIH